MDEIQPATVLAIDPGRSKLGVAVLDLEGNVIEKCLVSKAEMSDEFSRIVTTHSPQIIGIGDGTGSEWTNTLLTSLGYSDVRIIPEKNTTLEARELAWKENPPGGLYRLLPKLFWPTPADLDAWAAVVIGLRLLAEK